MSEEAKLYYDKKLRKLADHGLRLFERATLPALQEIKRIHLTAVCGTAMGSLAGLLSEAGYEISGSDEACYPPMDKQIAELGIKFFEGFNAENLAGADLVIVGNCCLPTNPEVEYARLNNIPTLSAPEAWEKFFIKDKKSLVVVGTHGKTTTTGMLAHVFRQAGEDPTYLIGGVAKNYDRTYFLGKGGIAIVEGDEYDSAYFDKSPKFLHYRPTSAIVTSLEFDHVDIYDDFKDYRKGFEFLVSDIPEDGNLLLWGDSEAVRSLAEGAKCNVYFYGLKEGNHITAKNIHTDDTGEKFGLYINGKELGELNIKLHGKHNLLNALAVSGMAISNGLSFEKLREGLATFQGMKRRQEIIGETAGITIIDDFAHHPTAVRETIVAINEQFPKHRLVVFFEPRSNTSRRKLFEEDYGKAFDGAARVYFSVPPLRHNDRREDFIDEEKIAAAVNGRGADPAKASYFPDADKLLQAASPELKGGDVILIMSNGAFGGIQQKLLDFLKNRPE